MASARSKAMMAVFQKWSAAVKDNIMFADRLVSLVVKQAFSPAMLKAKSLATKYEKMWAGYHELIGNELSSPWHSTFECVENPLHFQQFMQLVTRRVMDEAVKTVFVFESEATASPQAQMLKADEEQALWYM